MTAATRSGLHEHGNDLVDVDNVRSLDAFPVLDPRCKACPCTNSLARGRRACGICLTTKIVHPFWHRDDQPAA